MSSVARKAQLSPAWKNLVALMQNLNFGWINGLVVRNGEPVFDPPPRLVKNVKLDGDDEPRIERELEDFTLKAEIVRLISSFGNLENGEPVDLEIRHGLPCNMKHEQKIEN